LDRKLKTAQQYYGYKLQELIDFYYKNIRKLEYYNAQGTSIYPKTKYPDFMGHNRLRKIGRKLHKDKQRCSEKTAMLKICTKYFLNRVREIERNAWPESTAWENGNYLIEANYSVQILFAGPFPLDDNIPINNELRNYIVKNMDIVQKLQNMEFFGIL
jgi:hypothetical protein